MKIIAYCRNYRSFRKFQDTNIFGPNNFSAEVLQKKEGTFANMSVRDANIFTSLMKTRAWFEISGVWYGSIFMRLTSVGLIENELLGESKLFR